MKMKLINLNKKQLIPFLLLITLVVPSIVFSINTDEVDVKILGSYKVSYAGENITNYIDSSGYAKNKTREMISEVATRLFYKTAFGFTTEESKIDGNQGIDLFYEDDLHFSGETYVLVHEAKFHGKGGKPKLSKTTTGVRQMSSEWINSVARRACDDDDDSVDVCVSMRNVDINPDYAIRLANVFSNDGTNSFFSIVDEGAEPTGAAKHFYKVLQGQLESYSINWGDLKSQVQFALEGGE